MEDRRFKLKNVIDSNKDAIIESFIEFYGEEYRDLLLDKFSRVTIIPYMNPDSYSLHTSYLLKEISCICVKEFFLDIGIEYNEDNVKKYFNYEPCLDYSIKLGNIYNLLAKEELSKYNISEIIDYIKKIYDVDVVYQSEDYYKYVDKIAMMKPYYDKMMSKYKELKSNYQDIVDHNDELENSKKDIRDKYIAIFGSEISDFLSDPFFDRSKGKYYPSIKEETVRGFPYAQAIEAFSSKSNEVMNGDKEFQIDNIKRDRVRLFNSIGYNFSDYEELLKDEEVVSLFPMLEEAANKVLDTRERLSLEYRKDYLTSTSDFKMMREEVISANLMFDNNESLSAFNNNTTCVCPSINKDGELVSLLFVDAGGTDDIFDARVIHELNHTFELEFLGIEGKRISYVCGWDQVEDDYSEEEDEHLDNRHTIRPYEYLSEVINDLIASDVTSIMHKNGFSFVNLDKAKDRSGSSYSYANRLVRPFYDTFRKEIIDSRHGNMDILFNKVGKDNFLEFNKLINDYLVYFGAGFRIYHALEALNKNEENEDSKYYLDCINKSKELLEKMKNYSNTQDFRI